jgi:peptidoglycan/LPS O-acetylase OafA/YrhL
VNRFEPLDWLRGLLALSITVYHLTCCALQPPDASTFLGRLGIYGVSMFFVLSGLSMAAAYATFIGDGRSWAEPIADAQQFVGLLQTRRQATQC